MAWRPLSCLPRQALSHILDGTDIVQLSCLHPLPQGLELNLIHLCHVKAPSTDLASSFHEHMSRNPRPGQYASYRCLLFLLIAVSRGSYLSQSPPPKPLTGVGENVGFQLVLPVELLTAACVHPGTQSHQLQSAGEILLLVPALAFVNQRAR